MNTVMVIGHLGEYQFLCATPEFGGASNYWCIEDCSKKSRELLYKASLSSFGVDLCVTKYRNSRKCIQLNILLRGEGCREVAFCDMEENGIEDILHRIEESVLDFLHQKALCEYEWFKGAGGSVS